jgi:Ca-activated chloride channel family protein
MAGLYAHGSSRARCKIPGEMRTAAPMVLVVAGLSLVAAQERPPFRANTDIVLVPVSVTDRDGRFVHGLRADQFEILDGGARRAITQFTAGNVPLSLGILLDVSGSMMEGPAARAMNDARWRDTRRALELLLTRLDATDEILFAVFNNHLSASQWTQDHGRILDALDSLRPSGDTALLQAIRGILPSFRNAQHERKVLLLISDGNDTQIPADDFLPPETYEIGDRTAGFDESRRRQRDRLLGGSRDAIRNSDATLYAIGIGTRKGVPVDAAMLDGLTKESGGYVEPLRNPSEIAAAVVRICDELRSQYILAFESVHADGKYHPIRVRTKDTSFRVRARAGYVAASGP